MMKPDLRTNPKLATTTPSALPLRSGYLPGLTTALIGAGGAAALILLLGLGAVLVAVVVRKRRRRRSPAKPRAGPPAMSDDAAVETPLSERPPEPPRFRSPAVPPQ